MSIKDKNMKKHTYYFFADIIKIKEFDRNNINPNLCVSVCVYVP